MSCDSCFQKRWRLTFAFSLVIHSWAKWLEWKQGPPTRASGEKHRPFVEAPKEKTEVGRGGIFSDFPLWRTSLHRRTYILPNASYQTCRELGCLWPPPLASLHCDRSSPHGRLDSPRCLLMPCYNQAQLQPGEGPTSGSLLHSC